MGINKMRKLAAAFGLKEPAFEANDYFKATFYRPETAAQKVPITAHKLPKSYP